MSYASVAFWFFDSKYLQSVGSLREISSFTSVWNQSCHLTFQYKCSDDEQKSLVIRCCYRITFWFETWRQMNFRATWRLMVIFLGLGRIFVWKIWHRAVRAPFDYSGSRRRKIVVSLLYSNFQCMLQYKHAFGSMVCVQARIWQYGLCIACDANCTEMDRAAPYQWDIECSSE